MGSHVEHEHDLFIKRVSCVDSNINRTRLVLTHDLFINELVVSGSRVVSDFAIPSFPYCFLSCYILCVSLLFLLFLLYESSSYFVLVYLDNFWPYRAIPS